MNSNADVPGFEDLEDELIAKDDMT